MPRSLLFLLVMLPGAGPTQSVRRPDYAIDTGDLRSLVCDL